jgi:hypothetical protein
VRFGYLRAFQRQKNQHGRNQKKPKETSFTGLVKGKFTGNPWVFTMKYRVFL